MTQTTREIEQDAVSESELLALRERLQSPLAGIGSIDSRAVRVADVAEACGLTPDEVFETLRAIRQGAAFEYRAPKRPFPIVQVSGAFCLLVGFAVAYTWYLQSPTRIVQQIASGEHFVLAKDQMVAKPVVQPQPPPSWSGVPTLTIGDNPLPSGILVQVFVEGRGVQLGGAYMPPRSPEADLYLRQTGKNALPWDYRQEVDRVQKAAQEIARQLLAEPQQFRLPDNLEPDAKGSIPPKGFLRYVLRGWPGLTSGLIDLKKDPNLTALKPATVQFFQPAKAEFDKATSTTIDPEVDIVSPPPGYAVRLDGRRTDVQFGPPLSFAMSPAKLKARLLVAVQNAVYRDGRPPTGKWTIDNRDRPMPDRSYLEIFDPRGHKIGFEFPTRGGWSSESVREVSQGLSAAPEEFYNIPVNR